MSNIITCEQVSDGHPDKICDQIADRIVTDVLRHDRNGRVAVEVLIKDYSIVIAGEITSSYEPDYIELVQQVFENIGIDRLSYDPKKFEVEVRVSKQSNDIAAGVDTGGAGDQGMMFGYATNETPELLPMPFVLATSFLQKLKEYANDQFRADAKAQVSYNYDTGKIDTFLCSVQTAEGIKSRSIRRKIKSLMQETALSYGLNTDFKILVNPTGKFEIGGPFADTGVTGRKLACDTYGGVGHIGGGAMSGKDPTKVDRSGAYAARKVARDIVLAGYADKCEIQIAYAIGVAEPVSVHVETFGTEYQSPDFIEQFVRGNYDLTPKGIISGLHLLDIDYNEVSAYGHFGKPGLTWER